MMLQWSVDQFMGLILLGVIVLWQQINIVIPVLST